MPRYWSGDLHPSVTGCRVFVALLAIAAITAVCFGVPHVNPTTVALLCLVVLVIATTWGIVEATSASLVAVLCFNFFFLPPVCTLRIADPQNWVALVVLMMTGIIASQLSGRARRRTSRRLPVSAIWSACIR